MNPHGCTILSLIVTPDCKQIMKLPFASYIESIATFLPRSPSKTAKISARDWKAAGIGSRRYRAGGRSAGRSSGRRVAGCLRDVARVARHPRRGGSRFVLLRAHPLVWDGDISSNTDKTLNSTGNVTT